MSRKIKAIGLLILGAGLLGSVSYLRWASSFNRAATATGTRAHSGLSIAIDEQSGYRTSRPPVAERMTSEETKRFLRETKLTELKLDAVPMDQAIRQINQLLQKQMPHQRVPKIIWVPDDAGGTPRIGGMHLRQVPVHMVLRYLQDASRCNWRIYDGTVIFEPFRLPSDEEEKRFLAETRIDHLEISDANVVEAVEALASAVEKLDFDGRKPLPSIPSVEGLAETMRGDAAAHVRNVSLRNVSVREALQEICRQSDTHFEFFEGEIQIWPNHPAQQVGE